MATLVLSALFLLGLPSLQPVLAGPDKKDCSGTSTPMTPVSDLVGGSYKGSPGDRTAGGGLYPGGTNSRPNESAVRDAADAIGPLDAEGNPDPGGRFGLLSIGMSNTKNEFATFMDELAMDDSGKDPDLVVANGAQGGVDAEQWADPNGKWWNEAEDHVGGKGLTPEQVAVVWVKLAIGAPSAGWPNETERLQGYLAKVARIIKDRFPNVQIAYYSSRIYAGYTTRNLNPEPYAYESAFAVKWLIDDQLKGEPSLNSDPSTGKVEAPLITWGPYLWANGLEGRSDGLIWECKDFLEDGTHPSDLGSQKVADLLLDYFTTDSTARRWFAAGETIGQMTTTLRSSRERVRFRRPIELAGEWSGDGACSGPHSIQIRKRVLGKKIPSTIGTADVGNDGSWSFVHRSGRSAAYTASVSSTSNCDGDSSAAVVVPVRAKVTSNVPDNCAAPERIRGRVKPNHRKTVVRLQRDVGAGWKTVDRDKLNKKSKYAVVAPKCSARYRVLWRKQDPDNLRASRVFILPR